MRAFVLASLAAILASTASAMEEVDHSMKAKIDTYNLYANCFGQSAMAQYVKGIDESFETCHHMEPPAMAALPDLARLTDEDTSALEGLFNSPGIDALIRPAKLRRRRRRDAGNHFDVADITELYAQKKQEMATDIGNLTCVLVQMGMLTAEGEIDIQAEAYSKKSLQEWGNYSNALGDEEFLDTLVAGYQDCFDVSKSWPQANLDRSPMSQKFGRQHLFFECTGEFETELCYKWQIYQGLKFFEGTDTGEEDLGIPATNKFDRAVKVWELMYEMAGPEYAFVDDFMWGM